MSLQAAARRMDGGGVARQGHTRVSVFPHVRPSEAPQCPQEEVEFLKALPLPTTQAFPLLSPLP